MNWSITLTYAKELSAFTRERDLNELVRSGIPREEAPLVLDSIQRIEASAELAADFDAEVDANGTWKLKMRGSQQQQQHTSYLPNRLNVPQLEPLCEVSTEATPSVYPGSYILMSNLPHKVNP